VNKTQKKNNPQLKPFAPHRVRQVRPDLFKSETIADLSMPARVAFIGLMTCCDKNGRFEWKPRTLKSDILPHDNVDFESVLSELEKLHFVQKYPVGDHTYGQVKNWHSYQYIGVQESKQDAVYPEPWANVPERDENVSQRSKTFQNVVDTSKTLGVGVDVCVDVSESVCVGEDVHSISQPTNDRKNDLSIPSDTETTIKAIGDAFHKEADSPFKAGNDQKPQLITLIHEHGLEVMCEAARVLAQEDGNDWSVVWCPAALLLSRADVCIQEAKARLALDRKFPSRQVTQTDVQ
jgi:hypothetical protein